MCAVEWKKLGDVCEFRTGWGFPENEQGKKNEKYPFYKVADMNNSTMFMDVANNYISEDIANKLRCKPAPKGTIIFPKIGATMATNKKRILTMDSCYDNNIMGLIAKSISDKYLYYYISRFELLDFAKGTGAVPSLDTNKLKSFEIPIPSLVKQQEIVSHLDTFTTLISNLESELDMRRKQYEHYREVLFEEYEEYKVELGSFGQVEKAKNKKRITENAYSITQKGLVPTKDFFKEKTRVTSNDTSNYYIVQKNWFVYSPSRIDVGSINYLRDEGPAIVSPIDVVFSIDTNVCNPHFLLNYLQSQDGMFQILKYRIGVEGTGRRSLPFTDFAKIQVPLPSKQTQQEIVSKLDAFENLIQSLEQEIKLRKQQYEYYREKLLTFEKE